MLGLLGSRAGRIGIGVVAVLAIAAVIYGRGYAAGADAGRVRILEAQLASAERDRDAAAAAEAVARATIIGLEEAARYNREAIDAIADDPLGDACRAGPGDVGRLLDLR
jgi:hypothetical protein